MALILAALLKAETDAALAVFSTLRAGRVQRDAINAAAEVTREERDQVLISAVLDVIRTAEKMRDDVAHGNWGLLSGQDDALIWVESKFHGPWNAGTMLKKFDAGRSTHDQLAEHMFVYTKADLEEIRARIESVWNIAFDLTLYLAWTPERPDDPAVRYKRLNADPLVREALARQSGRRNWR